MINLLKRYLLYLLRWQLSTPILAIVLYLLSNNNVTISTIIANFIGGLIFFWVDRYIFKSKTLNPQWEIKNNYPCYDCNNTTMVFRLIKSKNYDRTNDNNPEFRCEACSKIKMKQLIDQGIEL
ncbi:MAG: hypothetical protein ACOC2W_04100 [bacterium]